ncbi:Zn(II)2Cys6 transcription factor [Aspergillus stella-maris]|uniref:Zn(II)2Cys6 transcription factor n=1 Tax=Aspergillus stella-maris TaxID=1810926 RepID=UPI003CCD4829
MSKRLPLSCENCRQRKIRCISSNSHSPCDTCARRGYASSCRFRRQDPYDVVRSPDSERLVGNVSALEDLLRQNIAVTSALLNQRTETRLPSPVSSPATSNYVVAQSPKKSGHAHQSGRLVTSPSNHVRFIPSNDLGDSHLIDAMHESTPGCPTGFPFFDQPGGNIVSDELLDMLPPLPQLGELKSVYFRVFSPLFHILHDPTFHARYEKFMQNPKAVSLPFLALLFVILSLAITALDDSDPLLMHLGRDPSPGANIRGLSAKYRSAAMRCLTADNFMFRHNLCTVQSLVLLIYAMNHAQGPAWSLLGTTLHIAVAIGCAVDPARLNVSRIEAEERRRCWAALQMLYTIQNTCLGNIMPFLIDAHVDLPADIEDEDLLTPAGYPPRSSELTEPGAAPTKMTYLLYKFRLYNLAFDICQLSPSARADSATISALERRIAYEQQCHSTRFAGTQNMELEPYHQAHYYILANYTNLLTLLLYRPFLSTNTSNANSQMHDTASSCCSAAATTILANFLKLSSDAIFRSYRWYVDGLGSFFAFFSITTLFILYGNQGRTANAISHNPETINLVLHCVDLLISNASRSAVCARAASVLEPVVQQLHLAPMAGELHLHSDPGTGPGLQDVSPLSQEHSSVQDAGVWGPFPELGNLFFDVPCEQWLSPAGFPWVGA